AGYAPAFAERSLDDDELGPVRRALDHVLAGHEPYPAVIVDRGWNLVTANRSALVLFTGGVAGHLLEPPVNVYRLALHPDGLARRVRNGDKYRHPLLTRLQRDLAVSGSHELQQLLDEVSSY